MPVTERTAGFDHKPAPSGNVPHMTEIDPLPPFVPPLPSGPYRQQAVTDKIAVKRPVRRSASMLPGIPVIPFARGTILRTQHQIGCCSPTPPLA